MATMTPTATKGDEDGQGATGARQKSRLSQDDVPSYSLDHALRIPRALAENYAFKPTRPLNVAGAMKMQPSSGGFRMLAGAAVAYGLTTAGAFAPEIGLTPLGLRIVRPTKSGDDLAAKREALLKPKLVGDFLRQYDGAPLPADQIAKNVLLDRGVPADRVEDVLAQIIDGATSVGFLKDIGGKRYVDLAMSDPVPDDKLTGATLTSTVAAPAPASAASVSVAPGVNINVEIHIAADASAQTIEEIFRNMRRYILNGNGSAPEE
jgi:hypothetical protein